MDKKESLNKQIMKEERNFLKKYYDYLESQYGYEFTDLTMSYINEFLEYRHNNKDVQNR